MGLGAAVGDSLFGLVEREKELAAVQALVADSQ